MNLLSVIVVDIIILCVGSIFIENTGYLMLGAAILISWSLVWYEYFRRKANGEKLDD